MLLSLLAYHQVTPAFLDLIFPFGLTEDARDFLFSEFKQDSELSDRERGLRVPELGRTGRRLQVCYSFRSPAETNAFPDWKWSVRQTAVYHSFDLESGQSIWILIKGDPQLKQRMSSAIGSTGFNTLRVFGDRNEAFTTSLATHQLFSDWAGENWRWYLNFLERKVQEITARSLTDTVVKGDTLDLPPPSSQPTRAPTKRLQRVLSWRPPKLDKALSWNPSEVRKALSWRSQPVQRASTSRSQTSPESPAPILLANQPLGSSPGRKKPARLPPDAEKKRDPGAFDIDDIRKIERVEERTNEALLIIKTQISVLNELLAYYKEVFQSDEAPVGMAQKCKLGFARFQGSISSAIAHFKIQHARVETLLKLLADRKSLVRFKALKCQRSNHGDSSTGSSSIRAWKQASYLLQEPRSLQSRWKA